MAFEKGKTIKELGIDINRKFRVIKSESYFYFDEGDILEWRKEENSACPQFKRLSDGKVGWHRLENLKYAEEEPKFKVGDKVKVKKTGKVSHCFKVGSTVEMVELYESDRGKFIGKSENGGNRVKQIICYEDLELAEPEKIAIDCETKEELDAVIEHMINVKKWKPSSDSFRNSYKDSGGCIDYHDEFVVVSKATQEDEGYTIKSASYVLGEKECYEMKPSFNSREIFMDWTRAEKIFGHYNIGTNQLINKSKQNLMGHFKEGADKVVKFAKNLKLSKEEKLLRKHGLKDECGDYTGAYRELVNEKFYRDNEAYVVGIATQMEEEDKESKKK